MVEMIFDLTKTSRTLNNPVLLRPHNQHPLISHIILIILLVTFSFTLSVTHRKGVIIPRKPNFSPIFSPKFFGN